MKKGSVVLNRERQQDFNDARNHVNIALSQLECIGHYENGDPNDPGYQYFQAAKRNLKNALLRFKGE